MIRIDGQDRTVLAWIPARGGSKGLPRKALLDLCGRPVLAYTIEAALAAPGMDRVLVNTDDEEIRALALALGAEVPFLRPAHLAQDDSGLEGALDYQWAWLKQHEDFAPDIHVGMSPTHPYRLPGSLAEALQLAAADELVVNVRSVAPTRLDPANCWQRGAEGLRRFLPADAAGGLGGVLQNLFAFNVVLECRRHLFYSERHRRPLPLVLSPLEGLDLDEPQDLDLARLALAGQRPSAARACGAEAQGCLVVLGKAFPAPQGPGPHLLRHPDFPAIGEAEVAAFALELARSERVLVSGCRIQEDAHPYRLFRQAEDGRLDYLLDVPQEIRGARQRYPELLRFVPGLVGLPEGLPLGVLDHPEDFTLFELPRERLLDAGDPLERLELPGQR
ncbi:MAG: NTP transferase domain-containing protein [Proteobacteria bacterium]|nr:NTP transferase domain-containing protein [Pseudomonadota bacterium]MBU1594041.1 NTP transferase domain-containing protein [Pseudomonadota bacterium]